MSHQDCSLALDETKIDEQEGVNYLTPELNLVIKAKTLSLAEIEQTAVKVQGKVTVSF